jgi:hypothetical protein
VSTYDGKIKIASDGQIRITAATTSLGGAQNKGTATDLLLTVLYGPDGATAVAGSTVLSVEGSNVTATATSNWTAVTPDKGTMPTVTASGSTSVHLGNLQFQYYHLKYVAAGASTADLEAVWNFHPVQDSVDATTP